VAALRDLSALVVLGQQSMPRRKARARRPGTRSYDGVIRNGRVLDGEGNPWILAGRRDQGR
jgi:hypothetical protein